MKYSNEKKISLKEEIKLNLALPVSLEYVAKHTHCSLRLIYEVLKENPEIKKLRDNRKNKGKGNGKKEKLPKKILPIEPQNYPGKYFTPEELIILRDVLELAQFGKQKFSIQYQKIKKTSGQVLKLGYWGYICKKGEEILK